MRRKRGTLVDLELAILSAGLDLHAQQAEEFHGYLLAKRLRQIREARRLVGHGTLYKALDRLEAAGLLASRWEDPVAAAAENRPRRRLYHVTAAGGAALAEASRAPLRPQTLRADSLAQP